MSELSDRLTKALADQYRIERELGQGGMATVYLAHDLKHDRSVALKILKPELAAVIGAERFLVEIRTTANLQHPHILPLFDSGTADSFLYYVMPFVEGETLRGKLERERQLDVAESVRLIRDVADALDYAHRNGVIHRDIKPENILLHDGRPVVADFGIALAVTAAGGGRMTETGLSLGTPHYMSPEQATADRDISARSDIYSLACVLYEMLAGEPPHVGPSPQAVLMRILTDAPRPVNDLRSSVPSHVAAALAKALEKLPADRFASAKAFGEALASEGFTYTAQATGRGMTAATRPMSSTRAPSAVRRVATGVGAVMLLAVGAAGWNLLEPAPDPEPVRLDLTVGPVALVPGNDVVISPDGRMLAYTGAVSGGTPAIYLRRLDADAEFRPLAGTEGGMSPDFSPDDQWIVFKRSSDGALAKVSVNGGGVSTIFAGNTAFFPHWGTNEQIVHSGPPGNFLLPAIGGEARPLTGIGGRRPFLLPDGSGVLGVSPGGAIAVFDLRTDSTTVLVPAGTHPVYVETGHILYVSDGNGLFAVPFDLKSHRVTGPPVRVLDRVAAALNSRGFSVSRHGTLVHHDGAGFAGGIGGDTRLTLRTFEGAVDTIPLRAGRRVAPRFSPDGRYIAYAERSTRAGDADDIYTFDLVTGTRTQITFEGDNGLPIWSPDTKRIVWGRTIPDSGRNLLAKASDNSGEMAVVLGAPGFHIATGWPRPDLLLVQSTAGTGDPSLFTMDPTKGSDLVPYLSAPWPEQMLTISPDGRFAAFAARETDQLDIWMRDFPTPVGKWRISPSGGTAPRWSPDGRYLYFVRTGSPLDSLFRVEVSRTPSIVVRAPELMLAIDFNGVANWDLHPDGKRFIVTEPSTSAPVQGPGTAPSRHLVVLNWFAELKANVKPERP